MGLFLEDEFVDARGKILVHSYGKKHINLIEIKKGFARGGHYHPYPQIHVIISGKVQYYEKNIFTKKEQIITIDKPKILKVPENTAHLFLALDDTIFVETYDEDYEAINYSPYRDIVEKK